MKNSQANIIVRDRGQLTIPTEFRENTPWINTNAVVTIYKKSKDEIVICNPEKAAKKKVDWDKVWKAVRRARAISALGPHQGPLSQLISEDRENH